MRFYVEVLSRTPGPSEVDPWADYLQATGDVHGMAKAFFDAPEYTQQDRRLIEHTTILYRTFLARDPIDAEALAWEGYFHGVLVTVEDAFVSSPEFQHRFQNHVP